MFYCVRVKQDKNTGCSHKSCQQVLMLFVLLSCSMASFAESSDLPGTVNKFQIFDDGQMRYSFPQWPLRKQVVREMIPPPPPGPYMSTALNDFSVKGFSFRRDFDRYKSSEELTTGNAEFNSNATERSMDIFSPDRPWPEYSSSTYSRHDERPRRWQPENGEHYVRPAAQPPWQAPAPYNPAVNNGSAYRGGGMPGSDYPPNMSGSGSNWMPAMGNGPASRYSIGSPGTQNFTPNAPNAQNQLNKPGMYSGSAVNRESQLPSERR